MIIREKSTEIISDLYLQLAPYVKLLPGEQGSLQLGSGTLCFVIKKQLQEFINVCDLLKRGIFKNSLEKYFNDNSVSDYIINKVEELINKKEFFLQFEYNRDHRYSRHLSYFNLAFPKYAPELIQHDLELSNILILGCGGIGNLLSVQMAAAGIGKITLVDDDIIEETNLTRQIMYSEADIGKPKVDVLAEKIEAINAKVSVNTISKKVTSLEDLLGMGYFDLVIVSADSPKNITNIVADYINKINSAFISIGYIQDVGVYGPIVDKVHYQDFVKGINKYIDLTIDTQIKEKIDIFNQSYQAPSFGPLNMLVIGLAARDILMFLGKVEGYNCSNKRIGIYPDLTIKQQLFWELSYD